MKPAFALDFRDETVNLLHRSGGGWQSVGLVPLDTPDLSDALGYLRATALGLSPRGLATKLIIPNEQVLYTSVYAPGPDEATRRTQILKALEGRTPYDVNDLVFDWSGSGAEVQVAVIARETLDEAEAFATEHRLNPLCFAADPDAGEFDGEAWFGPSALASTLLAAGDVVERDAEPVAVAAHGFAVEPVQEITAPEPEPETAPEQQAELLPLDAAEPTIVEDAPAVEEVLVEADEPELPTFETVSTDAAVDDLSGVDADLTAALAEPLRQPPSAFNPEELAELDEAPMALDVPADEAGEDQAQGVGTIHDALKKAQSARVIDTAIDDELPAQPAAAALAAFSSRRQLNGTDVSAAPPLGGAKFADDKPTAQKTANAAVTRPAGAKPPKAAAGKSGLRGIGALVSSSTNAVNKPRSKVVIPSALPPLKPTDPGASAATTAAAAVRPKAARPANGFATRPETRGKPRYLGLILTVVLLFLLAMIAAWSSYSLGAWNSTPAQDPVQTVAADPAPADLTADMPDANDEMLADMQDPAELAASNAAATQIGAETGDEATGATVAAEASALPVAEPSPNTEVTSDAAAPVNPTANTQDEIFLATADAPPVVPDPLKLPLPDARGDPLPAAQPAPPPFGTVYQFQPNGTIVPTPEGIITPEGVLLVAGKPARVPDARPESVIAAAAAVNPIAAPVAGLPPATDAAVIVNDPALADKRPKARPEGLAPPAAADQGSLAPAADSRIAGIRPVARPAGVLSAGNQARLASANASLAAQAEAAVQEAALTVSPTAVSISRMPAPRPRDLNRAVEAAVAAAVRQPEPEPEPEAAPVAEKAIATEADGEPELASAQPSIPTKASVAKQATFKNAINLSKLNLIGVYGSPSKRYALVRTAAGRYKKVKVGDTIDGGGRVAAITATEVRYQKGGKLVSLSMPKG